jgi:hypothetical protein
MTDTRELHQRSEVLFTKLWAVLYPENKQDSVNDKYTVASYALVQALTGIIFAYRRDAVASSTHDVAELLHKMVDLANRNLRSEMH